MDHISSANAIIIDPPMIHTWDVDHYAQSAKSFRMKGAEGKIPVLQMQVYSKCVGTRHRLRAGHVPEYSDGKYLCLARGMGLV